MKSHRIIFACIVAMAILQSIHAETENVGDYTWQYFVRDGKVWIGSQQNEVAAIVPKPVGEVTVPSELGGYEVYRIDDYAFYGCDEITRLETPNTIRQIGLKAFAECGALNEVNIANGVETIGENAFYCCSNLVDIVVPNSVTNICRNVFSCCGRLKSLTLPFIGSRRGTTKSAESAFGWIFGESPVSSADSNAYTHIRQWVAGATFWCDIPKSLRSIVIMDETVVAACSFDSCHYLEDVTIGNSVTNIQDRVFAACRGLKRLTLPFVGANRNAPSGTKEAMFGYIFGVKSGEGLVQVRQNLGASSGWTTNYISSTLAEVAITDGTIIPYGAFHNCSNLTSVMIGNSVTNIAKGAFAGCGALESMTLPFTGKSREALEWNVDHCECSLGYIFGSDPYQGSTGVKAYGSNGFSYYYLPAKLASIAVMGTERIRSYAFYNCTTLTNVTIDANAKKIGYQTFGNCTGLKQIEIPNGIVSFGSNTFRGSGLEMIHVPLSVTEMTESKGANFRDCTYLHLAYIPRWFKGRLPESTFQNCAADLQVIYYDENMKFFDETLRAEDNSSTNIIAVCTNDCRVTFDWKCSCEPMFKGNIYDYLSFEIDGVQQDFICGETDWQTKSYEVPGDGEHTFRWIYQKDEQDSAGEDCGWVRRVVVAPRVTLSFDGGVATGEAPASMSFYADDDSVVLPGCGTLSLAKHSFAGWSDGKTVYAPEEPCPYQNTAQTLTAVWAENTLAAPVITAPTTYEADSATVTITAEDGATVYYTLDGSTPKADGTGCRPYLGPFEIEGSVVIRAIAVRDNYYDSEVASFTVTRPTWTFGEYLNCPERTFSTGDDAEWVRAKGVSADGYALKSGDITHSQTSRLEAVVYGAGTIEFNCKVDGEIVKKIVYDGLAFCVDGVQQGDLIGENEWATKSFVVAGDGRHALSWLYVKDEEGDGSGEDCAWLDNVVWTPDDPLPALDGAATDNDVQAIIAEMSDVRLSDKIGCAAEYATFRNWVDSSELSHTLVKDAPNAWLSYVLDAPGLMAKAAPVASEDVVIESIEPSSITAEAFDLVVNIAGAEVGEGARLADALGVEGAAELSESAFSSDGLTVSILRTADGKAKATVTPDGAPASFFLRVRVK